MSYRVVVPARFASTRLPGKPLLDLGGTPMVVRVAAQAARSGARSVVVATDDDRVRRAVANALGRPAEVVLTRADHPSGSDRVMEVVTKAGWADDEIVVNLQGDEPLMPPAVIDQVAALARLASGWKENPCRVATLREPILRAADVFDPNIVKVIADRQGRALYFSRAPMPWSRTAFAHGMPDAIASADATASGWHRHIGIYAWRVDALKEFVAWPVGALERTEALEQLRVLENGRGIAVADAIAPVSGGVDTPADADRVRRALSVQPRG